MNTGNVARRSQNKNQVIGKNISDVKDTNLNVSVHGNQLNLPLKYIYFCRYLSSNMKNRVVDSNLAASVLGL